MKSLRLWAFESEKRAHDENAPKRETNGKFLRSHDDHRQKDRKCHHDEEHSGPDHE